MPDSPFVSRDRVQIRLHKRGAGFVREQQLGRVVRKHDLGIRQDRMLVDEPVRRFRVGALVGISMPGMNGLEATARLTSDFPDTRVLVISMLDQELFVIKAIKAGARAYLLKDSTLADLMVAMDAVRRDQMFLSPAISRVVLDSVMSGRSLGEPSSDALSVRQRQVLQLVAEGLSSKEIADKLSLSVRTIDAHRRHIMQLLGIHEIAGLVRYAVRSGLIEAWPPD
ncbi:MAG: DNA-binding NarL/FixJ family response regulator [Thalassolituus oleivorans]